MRLLPLLLLLLLAVVLCCCWALEAEAGKDGGKRRFIPFYRDEASKVQEGSIINVPTRCPPNMLKVGNRCRTVY